VESQGLERSFPELKDVETAQRTPEQWREVFHSFASEAMKQMAADRRGDNLAEQAKSRAELDDICEKMLPAAKRTLIESGMTAQKIEAMPVHQVALLYTRAAHHYWFDAAAKYYTLKYPDAIATLRVIEALRLYAAAHDGQLPKQLSDITEVPIPDDPVTGLPFEYELVGGKARLSGPTFRDVALNYEITIAASE
jgi:hypothetical protein